MGNCSCPGNQIHDWLFNEVLAMLPKKGIIIVCFSLFLVYMGIMMIYTMLPLYVNSLKGSEYEIGLAMGSGGMGYFVGVLLFGWLSDLVKRRVVFIILGHLGLTIIAVGITLSETPVQVMAVHFGGSIIASASYPSIMAYTADMTAREVRGRWMGVVLASFFLPMALGAFLTGYALKGGYNMVCYLAAVMGIFSGVLVALLVKEEKNY